jgi:1,4-dihydroxy-2-naphthoate octaprenyltransferase
VLLAYSYTGGPIPLANLGLGEVAVGLGFGVLPVIGSFFVQTGHLTPQTFWAGLPIAVLITLVLFVNQFPDYWADKAVGKKNLVVRLGRQKASILAQAMIAVPYAVLALAVIEEELPTVSLWAGVTAPMAIALAKAVVKRCERPGQFVPVMAGAIRLHLAFGLLLCASLVAARIV